LSNIGLIYLTYISQEILGYSTQVKKQIEMREKEILLNLLKQLHNAPI